MTPEEILLLWIAVSLYAISTIFYIISLVFRRDLLKAVGAWSAGTGLVVHASSLLVRWVHLGHGPYVSRYEVFSSDAWISVLVFLFAQAVYPQIKAAGAIVMPLTFLLLGFALMSSPEARALPPSLKSWWLILHMGFAKLSLGSIFIGFSASCFYLWRNRKTGAAPFPDEAASLESLDMTAYRFFALGFLFMGIMIASGAIWANNAWGRYWGWDPVETWSLIAWLTYGVYLHGRLLRGWKGWRSAVFGVVSLPIVFVSYFGVTILTQSIHSAYLVK